MDAERPAPASTATSAPSATNFFTVSGVAATLRSASAVSFRIASFTVRLFADQKDDDEAQDQRDNRAPLHQEYEALIALPVDDGFLLDLAFRRHADSSSCCRGDLLSTRRRQGKCERASRARVAAWRARLIGRTPGDLAGRIAGKRGVHPAGQFAGDVSDPLERVAVMDGVVRS